jgi:hypothetical protein
MGMLGDLFGGGDSEDAAIDASEIQAKYQMEALDYLKQQEAMPTAYREGAMPAYAAEYGLTMDQDGNVISDGSTVAERALSSPFYTAGRDVGEDAVMRNQSMTGGLRSGNTQDALARANQSLYTQSYGQQLQGLQGLMGQPSNANNIANLTQGIGTTYAQGITGGAQGQQAGMGMGLNTVMQGIGMFI